MKIYYFRAFVLFFDVVVNVRIIWLTPKDRCVNNSHDL